MVTQEKGTQTLEDLIREDIRLAIEIETMEEAPVYRVDLEIGSQDIQGIPQFIQTLSSKLVKKERITLQLESEKEKLFSGKDITQEIISYKNKEREIYISEIKKMRTECSNEIAQLEKVMAQYALCLAKLYLINKYERHYTKINGGIEKNDRI